MPCGEGGIYETVFFSKAGILVLAAILTVIGAVGCQKKDDKQEDQQTQHTEQKGKGGPLEIGEVNHHNGLDFSITNVYYSDNITTGDQVRAPSDGKVFLIAEVELVNHTDSSATLESDGLLIPSVDGIVTNLNDTVNRYPNVINDLQNLINRRELQLFPEKPVTGLYIFEVNRDYTECDFTYHRNLTVYDTFRYTRTLEQEASETKEKEALASVSSQETALRVMDVKKVDPTDYSLQSVDEKADYIAVTVEIENCQKELISTFNCNDLVIEAGGKACHPLMERIVTDYIPPGKKLVQDLLYAVDSTENDRFLKYLPTELQVKLT